MGLVNRLPRPKAIQNLSVTDEKAWNPSLWNLIGSQSLSGENVNEFTALNYSAVWNAVSLISGTISTLPLHLLRKSNKKTVQVIENPLFRVMHSQFNPLMTAQVGREVMAAHILTWGNCYAEKVVSPYSGEITELWPIPPNRVKPKMQDGNIIYVITVGSKEIELGRENILHIPGLGFDGFMGYSVINLARKSIGLSMAMETYGSLFFSQGTHPDVTIRHPRTLEDPKTFMESFSSQYSGLSNSNRVLLLQEGMELEKIGIPPEDGQFLESRQFQIPEIARWFNLPPHKLKDLTRSSFNNIESEQISFVTDTILPWLIRFEQNYDLQMLTDPQKIKQMMYFHHNVDGLLRGNSKDRAAYYRIMFQLGAMSSNDIREKENLDPIDGGDEHFVPLNMIPLSRVKEYIDNLMAKKNSPKDRSLGEKEEQDVNHP
jgi:HK97 family phage portal protein